MRDRYLQIRLARDKKSQPTPVAEQSKNCPESIAIEVVKETGAVIAGSFILYKVVSTACRIVEHTAVTYIK